MARTLWMWAVTGCLAFVSAVHAEDSITLHGRFVFDGKPEKPKVVKVRDELRLDESLVVDEGSGGIGNIVVSLLGKPGQEAPAAPVAKGSVAVIDIVDADFQPRVTVMNIKQRLLLVNTDKEGYAVTGELILNEPLAVALKPGEHTLLSLPQAEKVPATLRDAIHPWMTGYLLVTDSYAAVTDREGRFTIADLPPGKWTFRVWHERAGYIQTVKQNGESVTWKLGRVTVDIKPGKNDLGEIRVAPAEFAER